MEYYRDKAKITFDGAERIVDEYLERRVGAKRVVRAADVARAFSVEDTHHNLYRIRDALERRLEPFEETGNRQGYVIRE